MSSATINTAALATALHGGRWPLLKKTCHLSAAEVRDFLRSPGSRAVQMLYLDRGTPFESVVQRQSVVVVRGELTSMILRVADDSVFDGMFFPNLQELNLYDRNSMSSLDLAVCACPDVKRLGIGSPVSRGFWFPSITQPWPSVEDVCHDASPGPTAFFEKENVAAFLSHFSPLRIRIVLPRSLPSCRLRAVGPVDKPPAHAELLIAVDL